MGLYLAPASSENIQESLLGGIDISIAEKFLSDSECSKLKELLGTNKRFHCWAMTDGSRSKFEKMERGDTILFVEKGTGFFTYQAEALLTVENEQLGNHLWSYVPRGTWKLIYFVTNIQQIKISKSVLVTALGYNSNFEVPGIIRVKESFFYDMIDKYGSIQSFLNVCTKQRSTYDRAIPVRPDIFTIKEKSDYSKQNHERPKEFLKLIEDIENLRKDSQHKERAHESLVEYFYEILGFDRHTEIKYRQGRVDIGITYNDETIIVNEVKKDWNLSYNDKKTIKQGFGYALETGARFVAITNGDYYAIFDRSKGLDMNSNLIGEFRLTKLSKNCLQIIEKLKKEIITKM